MAGTTDPAGASKPDDKAGTRAPVDNLFAWGAGFGARPVPVPFPPGVIIKDIDGDLALTTTGKVLVLNTDKSWTEVPFSTEITAIADGDMHHLVLTSTGKVLAWGDNGTGQLGNGTRTPSDTPVEVQIPNDAKITAIDAGTKVAKSSGLSLGHSLAVTSTGDVLAWGDNSSGQLGDPEFAGDDSTTPIKSEVSSFRGGAFKVAAGALHSLALTEDGIVYAWGDNYYGEVGRGTGGPEGVQYPPRPVKTPPQYHILDIDVGPKSVHSLAIANGGRLFSWGYNDWGQVGIGEDDRDSCISKYTGHVKVVDCPLLLSLPDGAQVQDVAAGLAHSLAATVTGQVLSWGANDEGQLGRDTPPTLGRNPPGMVQIPGNTPIAKVAATYIDSLALPLETEPTTTRLTANPTQTTFPAPVTFTATVTCPVASPTGTVTFREGTTNRGTRTLTRTSATTAQAALTIDDLPVGRHTLTAHYNGDPECVPSLSNPATATLVDADDDCGCNGGGGGGGGGGKDPGKGKVTAKHKLTVRQSPRSDSKAVSTLRAGQTIAIQCKATGQPVGGNNVWYKLAQDPRGWVTARYVKNLNPIPQCPK